MLDWPMSSPQMMTMLGFCCCASAGGQASTAANSDATTNDVIRVSFTAASYLSTRLGRHLRLRLPQDLKQPLLDHRFNGGIAHVRFGSCVTSIARPHGTAQLY